MPIRLKYISTYFGGTDSPTPCLSVAKINQITQNQQQSETVKISWKKSVALKSTRKVKQWPKSVKI